MSRCEERRAEVLLYLDNALSGRRLEEFRVHLAECLDCRERLEEERALSCLLHQTRPLYSAPQTLRDRIVSVAEHQPFTNPLASDHIYHQSGRRRVTRWLFDLHATIGWKPLAFVVLLLVLSFAFLPGALQRVRAGNYIEAATRIHRSYLDGTQPLQYRARSPEEVTAWFAGKAPFDFRLPASQSPPNSKPVYWLAGASLVSYKGTPAALVAYETPTEKISLVIAPSKSAVVAGGEEVRSGNLAFHYRSDTNFEVITWTNHGLAYALVSALTGSPRHSCLVCHQDLADQNLFKH